MVEESRRLLYVSGARARPRSDAHDKMGTIEQQAQTSYTRSEA